MKKLSIITTAYKSECYLKSYFENIICSDGFSDYQIIIILNEPSEEEKKITEYYKKLFPENIKIEIVPLESIATSTNRGFFLADTKYITCADVDDMRLKDTFTRQIQTLETNQKASYTYGDFVIVDEQTKKDGLLIKTVDFAKTKATFGSIVGPNHFFKKSILNTCGYWDEQFKSGSDFDFQIRAAFNFDFKKTTGTPLLYYTRFNNSNSASSNELQQIERTVIELRYGIYDKINYNFLPKALKYDIYHIYYNGKKIPVSDLVPNYEQIMTERYNKYFKKGLRNNFLNKTYLNKLNLFLKYFLINPKWTINKTIKKLKK
ncbi:MAG: glycosyltransferase [Candidatus Margulisiibacteriota bacterium]|jgi:hypothetical protein